jgi:branched-subunit amino acid transport protein
MNAWTIILIAGLGSYLLRMSMISSDRLRLPPRLDDSVALVAPAAFAALAVTSLAVLVLGAGVAHGLSAQARTVAVPMLLAVAVAMLAVARTGRPYLAVVAGMPTFWLMAALMSR